MKLAGTLFIVMTIGVFTGLFGRPIEQQAWMVYPSECLEEITIDKGTYMEMPLVDGLPDKKHARVVGEHVVYNSTCKAASVRVRKQ